MAGAQYYGTYAQYFVKYLQAYRDKGVPVDYVSVQNEPTCCSGYPSMRWNASGLAYFTKNDLLPALKGAGLSTKVLALDWNWDRYAAFARATVDDPACAATPTSAVSPGTATAATSRSRPGCTTATRACPPTTRSTPADSGSATSSGRTCTTSSTTPAIGAAAGSSGPSPSTRTAARTTADAATAPDWSPCTTAPVRHGTVDYTVEYYTMGHLTKFVRPGARRIASTASATVPNVAWKNPDGSKALIAYNDTSATRTADVNWGGEHVTYDLPAGASATFTWSGNPSGSPSRGALTADRGPVTAAYQRERE